VKGAQATATLACNRGRVGIVLAVILE
jgi:hypothetical protein